MVQSALSAASGDYTNAGIWDVGVVPGRNHSVTIRAGHRVRMAVSGGYAAAARAAGGTAIQIVTGGALIITTGVTVTLRLQGNIQVNGSLMQGGSLNQINGFGLTDAGKLAWKNGASEYIFDKDYSRILELAIDPKEDVGKASNGSLRVYRGVTFKRRIELSFEDVGATQFLQFASIWKRGTRLDFWRRATDDAKLGTFWWTEGLNFNYSDWGIYYKNLYSGRITLEEI